MINEALCKYLLLKHIEKAFKSGPEAFQKYFIASDIVNTIAAT